MGKDLPRKAAQCSWRDFDPILCQVWLKMMNRKNLQRVEIKVMEALSGVSSVPFPP